MPEQNEQQDLIQNYWNDGLNNDNNSNDKNKQSRENQKKFNKEGPLRWWRIVYIVLIFIICFSWLWLIHLNPFLEEFILVFLIIGSLIWWLFMLRKKNRERIIENKWVWMTVSSIIAYIFIPMNFLITYNNVYWTINSFMVSYVTYFVNLQEEGVISETFLNKNKEQINNEFTNIANEKAGYNFIWKNANQAPEKKLWSDFRKDVFDEFNPILLEKIESWERAD